MDDAGAVIISSRKYCFYQTGVDRRNRISTSWPCKRHRKRETFVRFQHFLSHPFIWFSILSESVLSSHSSSWIGFTGQSKWHEMSIVASCRRDVRASYAQGGCFVPGPVYEVLFFNFFSGISRLPVWFITVGQDSGGWETTTKNPGTPWR